VGAVSDIFYRVDPAERWVLGGGLGAKPPHNGGFEGRATALISSFPFFLLSLSASFSAFLIIGHSGTRVLCGPGLPNQTRVVLLPGSISRVCRVLGKTRPGAHL
jgi:hypothetical protein